MRVAGSDDVAPAGKRTSGGDSREKLASFIFGVLALATMLALSLWIPNPTDSQWFVFRVVLAAAACGSVVFLPGAINLNLKPMLRASGALAVFGVVYAVNPPKTTPTPPISKYNLVLKLTFSKGPNDQADKDVLPLNAYEANVSAVVNNNLALSDLLVPTEQHIGIGSVQRAQGGITVTLPDLSAGDNLRIHVDQGGRYWRSDDMKMPEANLQMYEVPPPSPGGQR